MKSSVPEITSGSPVSTSRCQFSFGIHSLHQGRPLKLPAGYKVDQLEQLAIHSTSVQLRQSREDEKKREEQSKTSQSKHTLNGRQAAFAKCFVSDERTSAAEAHSSLESTEHTDHSSY